MKIAILGAGAWGSALAVCLSRSHSVALWARRAQDCERLRAQRTSRYLPGIELPATVTVEAELPLALRGAQLALVATATAGLRETAGAVAAIAPSLALLWACKGFERDTGALPHEIVASLQRTRAPSGSLSGPSFAQEVARGQPTALVLASVDEAFAVDTAAALNSSRLRIYSSGDVIGVELGGALKNVIAIAAGICDGLALGHNARAALITRGLAEITRLGCALGGRAETFAGLAGLGDLVLTCTGDLSRNRAVGVELAAGRPLEAILAQLGHVAEGVVTTPIAAQTARRLGVEMPIVSAIESVLAGRASALVAVEQLLSRDPRRE